MNLNKDPESWAKVDAKAVTTGSQAQAENVLKMALHDIAKMASELEAVRKDRDRIARNRDMWKGQVDRQAAQLTKLQWQHVHTAPKDGTEILLWGACFPPPNGPRYAKGPHVGWWEAGHAASFWSTRSPDLVCDAILWMPISKPHLIDDVGLPQPQRNCDGGSR